LLAREVNHHEIEKGFYFYSFQSKGLLNAYLYQAVSAAPIQNTATVCKNFFQVKNMLHIG
jgi:hypothetical protein